MDKNVVLWVSGTICILSLTGLASLLLLSVFEKVCG